MASIGIFEPRGARFNTTHAPVAYSGNGQPVDVAYVGADRYVIAETGDGIFYPMRVMLVKYTGQDCHLLKEVYVGGLLDSACGITFDGEHIILVWQDDLLFAYRYTLDLNGNIKNNLTYPIIGFYGVCYCGTSEIWCKSTTASLHQMSTHNGITPVRQITVPAVCTGIANNDRCLFAVAGTSVVYQLDWNGHTEYPWSERSGFNPTGICFNGLHFVCVNGTH